MRRKPILSLTLIAAALAVPGTATSLGLGKLTVQSGLGQPLSAQIELTSIAKDELVSLSARVADPSLYRQNNLAYQGVLSRARVAVERLPSGEALLRVTTPGSVVEPYLDLLVEVNWASGRVVRAYTFLLDPPGTAVPVASIEPVTPARIGSGAPAAAVPAARAAADKGAGGNTYSVRRGDTLSKIAAEYKSPSATLEQMLVALYAGNKDAFDGNMNRLRAGAILTIPSPEQAAATPPSDAAKTVRVQATDWRAYQDRLAGAAPAAVGGEGRAATGKIGTAVEEKVPAAQPGRDQLKVSPEAGQVKGGTLAPAEEVVARDKALKEAQARIGELEKTLKDLQKALELKGQTGAQLQAQAEAAKAAPSEAPKIAAPAVAPAPEAKAPPAAVAPIPPPAAVTAVPPPAAETKAAEPPKAAEAPKAPEPPKAVAPAKAPEARPGEAAKATAKAAPPKAEPSFFDDLFGGTPMWVIGGGAVAALGGIAALVAARRRKTVKFEDSIIGGTDIKTNTVFGSTGGGVVNTGENSLATDFSREGLGNIETDEVDPIAEAEVYLAYGRDAQAEEILKDALKKDKQRQEIYLKLLEIHAQHNKPSAFETVAAQLYSVCQGKGEVWQKAVNLGRQLDPNNPMFGEGAAAASAAAAVAASAARTPQSDSRREASQAGGAGASTTIAREMEGAEDSTLDFRFDEDVSISRTKQTTQAQLDMINAAEREFEESSRRAAAKAKSGHETASSEIAGAAAAARRLGAEPEEKSPALPDYDFRLDDADKPAQIRAKAPEASPSSPPAAEVDKLALSFESERTHGEDTGTSGTDGQWHDAATKLDLAKAYHEMGDVEGAREILQEVLHEGDEQQRAEAQALLAKLG